MTRGYKAKGTENPKKAAERKSEGKINMEKRNKTKNKNTRNGKLKNKNETNKIKTGALLFYDTKLQGRQVIAHGGYWYT